MPLQLQNPDQKQPSVEREPLRWLFTAYFEKRYLPQPD